MKLHDLKPARGSRSASKRVGRGSGSGQGRTAGRGDNGQKSRSGYSRKRGFEGGQMPLHRRLPKRGFTNIFRQEWVAVNLVRLVDLPGGTEVSPEFLRSKGWVPARELPIKILANGELTAPLTVQAHKFSAAAKAKIEAAGGKAEVLAMKVKGPKPRPLSPRAQARANKAKTTAPPAGAEPTKETPA
jgi:large subunit ribosomal protein L15